MKKHAVPVISFLLLVLSLGALAYQLIKAPDVKAAVGTLTIQGTTGTFTFGGSGIWNSSGSVGVGTTSPGSKLSINGNISAGSYYATAAPSNGMIISGSVGIGTTNPTVALDVVGGLNITGDTNICSLVAYTSTSDITYCPSGYYTWSATGLTDGNILCCKVSNPI